MVPEAALNEPYPEEHIGINRLHLRRAPSHDPWARLRHPAPSRTPSAFGQCPLPVTFQMVALILPMAKDCESHWFSPCSGWRSCHTLRWDSTAKSTRGCEGRGGRLRLPVCWTLQVIPPGSLMVPEAALPLYRLHIHICDSFQATGTLSGRMSASVGCCGGSSVYGRSTDADLFKQALGDCSQARDARA